MRTRLLALALLVALLLVALLRLRLGRGLGGANVVAVLVELAIRPAVERRALLACRAIVSPFSHQNTHTNTRVCVKQHVYQSHTRVPCARRLSQPMMGVQPHLAVTL